MSYVKGEKSRGVNAIAARDNVLEGVGATRGFTMPSAQRPVAPVSRGLVPPRATPAPATGLRAGSLAPLRPAPHPASISVTPPPRPLRPLAVVTPAGQPLARVTAVPVPGNAARVAVTTGRSMAPVTPGRVMQPTAARPVVRTGTATTRAVTGRPVWVNKISDCPRGYFVKKTVVTGVPPALKFWCWPNPVSTQRVTVRGVRPATPAVHVQGVPAQRRTVIGHLVMRGPTVAAPGLRPMTPVTTSAGPATVISTPMGPVAVPGAVPAPPDVPVGSTVQTPSGPATVTDTPDGPVAIPESMAPPEDEWSNDAMIDDLLGDTKQDVAAEEGPSADTQPGAPVTDEGPPPIATPAEAASIDASQTKSSVSKLALIGGAGWLALKFFL